MERKITIKLEATAYGEDMDIIKRMIRVALKKANIEVVAAEFDACLESDDVGKRGFKVNTKEFGYTMHREGKNG